MSVYVPVEFEDGVTPLNAETLNQLDEGIEALDQLPKIPTPLVEDNWLKVDGGALVWAPAPSGGGGAIEYENAWNPATAYTPGDVVFHEGVEFLAVNPSTGDEPDAPAAPPANTPIPLVTALPALPQDGDEVILVDSLTAPTYSWRLRYVAAKASNRWVFVGGSSAVSEVVTSSTTASTTYADLAATVGPSFTVPVAGDYVVEIGFRKNDGAGIQNYMSFAVGATAAADADAAMFQGSGGQNGSVSRLVRKAAVAAAVALVAKYRVSASTGTFDNRWMRVTPVAVGG